MPLWSIAVNKKKIKLDTWMGVVRWHAKDFRRTALTWVIHFLLALVSAHNKVCDVSISDAHAQQTRQTENAHEYFMAKVYGNVAPGGRRIVIKSLRLFAFRSHNFVFGCFL